MKIAMLLSGGVDSSVSTALLKEQGHDLTAFYLKIWLEDETSFLGSCPWQEDLRYVTAVCEKLNIPLHVVSLQREYHDTVVNYTISEIKAGRTPNPDIFCNAWIKFGLFFNHIDDTFDYVATGHYAQTKVVGDSVQLICSPDPVKDQTYFLAYLTQKQLNRALFPIGHLTKEQVRALANKYDLATKDRKDSQGICFLGKLKFNEFLHHYLGDNPGNIIEYETGKVLGNHKGFWYHTIGQRQGSGLAGGPWYVVAKNPAENEVFVSRSYYAADKERRLLKIGRCNWIPAAPKSAELKVKMRHGAHFHDCMVTYHDDGTATILLAANDQGIAQGQFAVLYDGNRCVGSGIIY